MRFSRRNFLQVAVSSLPAFYIAPSERLILSQQANTADVLKVADIRYRTDIRIYAAQNSKRSANELKHWIDEAAGADFQQIVRARIAGNELRSSLEMAEEDLEKKEKIFTSLKEVPTTQKDAPVVTRMIPGNLVADPLVRQKELTTAKEQSLEARARVKDLKQQYRSALMAQVPSTVKAGPFELVPAWADEINSDPNLDMVDFSLCALYTSNQGRGSQKPWNRLKEEKDMGVVSVTVDYTIPANPPCWGQKGGNAAVLYDFRTADGFQAEDLPCGLLFREIPVVVTKELGLSLRMFDVADRGDQGQVARTWRFLAKTWDILKGSSLNQLNAAASKMVTDVVQQFEKLLFANEKNFVVWDSSTERKTSMVFTNNGRGGTYGLREGYYVAVDSGTNLKGFLLGDGFRVYHPTTGDPAANYLVFGITKTPSQQKGV